jgi:hypothetical protein
MTQFLTLRQKLVMMLGTLVGTAVWLPTTVWKELRKRL